MTNLRDDDQENLFPNENVSPAVMSSSLIPLMASSTHIANPSLLNSSSGIPSAMAPVFVDADRTSISTGRNHHRDFVCGLGAAVFETSITYPLNKLIFRQQLHGISVRQSMDQLKQEGIRFVYRGLLFPLMQKGTSRSLMFGMYDEYRRLLGCRHTMRKVEGSTVAHHHRHTFTMCHALAAFLAGVTEAIGLTPFERVQVLMQNAKYHAQFRNSLDALKTGLRPYGIREYYRGLSMILIRNGSTNALFFAFRDPLKQLISHADRSTVKGLSDNRLLVADFCSGAVLGACLSTIFFPLNVIKSRMQSRLGGEFRKPTVVLLQILKERGFSARELYRGVTLNFSRSFLTWGLTNACYEFIQRHLFGKRQTVS